MRKKYRFIIAYTPCIMYQQSNFKKKSLITHAFYVFKRSTIKEVNDWILRIVSTCICIWDLVHFFYIVAKNICTCIIAEEGNRSLACFTFGTRTQEMVPEFDLNPNFCYPNPSLCMVAYSLNYLNCIKNINHLSIYYTMSR